MDQIVSLDSFARSVAQKILDHVHFGVLLVGPQLQLWLVNEAARRRCTSHPMLRIEDGTLVVAQRRHHADVMRAVAAAGSGRWSMVQLVHDADRLVLAIMPLSRSADGTGEDPVLIVLGVDSPCDGLAIEFFASSHALTPAEIRVLRGLKEGLSPRQLAREHDVALSTVRTQIASMRSKTGARGIAELVRTLSCLPPIMTTHWRA